jgi:hypothetical protein
VIVVKKKVLLIVVTSFMLMSVVSAASLWGKYEGNQIIRITVNGSDVTVNDVPAIGYQGRTMIPLYLLKEAGLNYTWDQASQTVNILPQTQQEQIQEPPSSGFKISDISRDMKKLNIEFVEYVSDGKGFNRLTFYYDYDLSSLNAIEGSYGTIFSASLKTDASMTKIVDKNGVSLRVNNSSISDFYNGKITADELQKLYVLEGVPQSNTSTGNSGADTTLTTVNSKIDGDFDGFDYEKIFKLLNGQIWQQTSFDYKYSYKYSPKVTIYKDGAFYYMIVDGVDKKVRVEQIK